MKSGYFVSKYKCFSSLEYHLWNQAFWYLTIFLTETVFSEIKILFSFTHVYVNFHNFSVEHNIKYFEEHSSPNNIRPVRLSLFGQSFVFHRRKSVVQIRNNMKVNTFWPYTYILCSGTIINLSIWNPIFCNSFSSLWYLYAVCHTIPARVPCLWWRRPSHCGPHQTGVQGEEAKAWPHLQLNVRAGSVRGSCD